MNPFRSLLATSLLLLLLTIPATALIMVGRGNAPVTDSGWPAGALAVANLKSRVGWWEGPPFGGGEWCFLYRGDTAALEEAIKNFAGIRAPGALQIFLHEGPQSITFLSDPADPKADTHYDCSFTVWNPRSWHQLYNDPRSTFTADQPNFRKPVDPPRLDVYLTERIDWKKITVPEGVQLIDERKAAGAKPAAGAVIRGDIFDMATAKPINGATVQLEKQGAKPTWEAVASGVSNANGRFEVAKIPAGHYRLIATATGYAPRMLGYEEIKDGMAQKRVIELSTAAKLSGTITDPADGRPVPGVTVSTSNNMGIDGRGYPAPDRVEVKTDDKGQFTLIDVPTGFAQIWARSEGRFQIDPFKLLPVPETNTITIQMATTGGIKGKVVDAKGKPSTGGTIHAWPPGDPIGKWGGSMNVEADGSFEFKNVPPGPYTISTKPSYPGSKPDPNAQQITVTSGKTVEVTVKN